MLFEIIRFSLWILVIINVSCLTLKDLNDFILIYFIQIRGYKHIKEI